MSSIEKYGRFIEDEGCFELTAEPPRKWNNFHFNKVGEFEIVSEVSNIGDGQVFIRDGEGRLTNLVGWDCKYVYVRDDETSAVFCPWGAPAPQPVENRSAKYYAAKTVITGTCQGLKATQRVFVPKDYPIEVTTLTVENLSDRPRQVSLFAYAGFQLTGVDEENNYIGAVNSAEVHPEIGGVFVTNGSSFVPSDRYKGFLVALDGFTGGSGYRDNFRRAALMKLRNSEKRSRQKLSMLNALSNVASRMPRARCSVLIPVALILMH